MQPLYVGQRLRMLAGAGAHRCLDGVGCLRNRCPNQRGLSLVGRLEPASDDFGRLHEQFHQIVARDVGACPDAQREIAVVLRPPDQNRHAGRRKSGAAVGGGAGDDLMVAPLNQNIRHGLGQNAPAGNGQQVSLALGSRVFHQGCVFEPSRVRQDRRGHVDRVVECQRADDDCGRVGDQGEPAAKFRAGRLLDGPDEPAHDVAEQIDLIVGKPARAVDEEIRDTAQDLGAPRWILADQHTFEIADQMFVRVHQATFFARGNTASRSSSECGTGRPNR
jgi:hypothetical protein